MKPMLGEQGTEQFTVRTQIDGKTIREQKIHDPFITCTTVLKISRWDLFKALFRHQFETRVEVHVWATEGAQRAIMTLNPDELQRETAEILEQRRTSRETSPTGGYCIKEQA